MKTRKLMLTLFLFGLLGAVVVLPGCQSSGTGSMFKNPFASVPTQWEPEIVEGELAE